MFKYTKFIVIILIFVLPAFFALIGGNYFSKDENPKVSIPAEILPQENEKYENIILTDGFDYPVGKPNAKGFHNLQDFQVNRHLGEDWNDFGGCNNDLGKPVYSIANGFVSLAKKEGPGWGNVVRIVHKIQVENEVSYVESLYAHLEKILVNEGGEIKKGDQIGTIGNANGRYCAHLHLELRSQVDLPLGGGYSDDIEGFLDPSDFIDSY